jgi:hypothetical protein
VRTRGLTPGLDSDCSRASRCWDVLGRMRAGEPGELRSDGPLVMRFPWWRAKGVEGEIRTTGRWLNGDRMVLAAEVHPDFGLDGCQASALVFPSDGCWKATACVGAARLAFVTGARGLPAADRGRRSGIQLGAACPQSPLRSGPNYRLTGQRVIVAGLESSPDEGLQGCGCGRLRPLEEGARAIQMGRSRLRESGR